MIKIAVISFDPHESYNGIKIGIAQVLDRFLGKENYQTIYYDGPTDPDLLNIYIRDYIKNIHIDLIFTLSPRVAELAAKYAGKYDRSLIIVCWALFKLLSPLTKKAKKLTGVTCSSIKTLLPAQLLLRIDPTIEYIAIPFRLIDSTCTAGLRATRAQQHLAQYGIWVKTIPLSKEQEKVAAVEHELIQADAIVASEANLFYHEFAEVENIAHKHDILSWIGVEYCDERHALLSVINDFKAIGKALGRQAYRALTGPLPPIRTFNNFRTLRINRELAAKKGLTLSARLEKALGQALERYEDMQTLFSVVANPGSAIFEADMTAALTHHMRLSNDAHFHYHLSQDWPEGDQHGRNEKLHHIASMSYTRALVIIGYKNAETIIQRFQSNGTSPPVICISNQNELQDSKRWHLEPEYANTDIAHIFLPPPSLVDQTLMIIAAAPHIEQICILVGYHAAHAMPMELQSRLAQWQTFCSKHDITGTIRFSPHSEYLEKIPVGLFSEQSAWIVCPENIPANVVRTMGEWFTTNNVIALCGSLTWARWFPLSIGIDADAIAERVYMPLMKRLLIEQQKPEQEETHLEYYEWYRFCINEQLASSLNLNTAAIHAALSEYQAVPVEHAFDTALCLGIK